MNKDKNKNLAKFMGGKLSKHPSLNGAFVWTKYDRIENRLDLSNLLKFDTNYEWLMDVYYKILDVGYKEKEIDIYNFDIKINEVSLNCIIYDKIISIKYNKNECKDIKVCLYNTINDFVDIYLQKVEEKENKKLQYKDKRRQEYLKNYKNDSKN